MELARNAAGGVFLACRSDHGTQYTSEDFKNQVKAWGMESSYGFVRQPQTNGVAERFIRALKEQVLHGGVFQGVADATVAIKAFVKRYNEERLVEKNGLLSPLETRRRHEEGRAMRPAA